MKQKICLVTGIIFIAALFSVNSMAADKEEKIGFINIKEIMLKSNAGKKAAEEFKKLYEKDTKKVKAAEDELKKLKDELDKQDPGKNRASRSEKENTYKKKLRGYQIMVNDMSEELKKQNQEVMKKLVPRIMKTVNAVAEKGKYTLVVDVATMPVHYWDQQKDISQKVIDELNKTK